MQFQIGVMADSFRLPIREALKKAAQLGADGVQIYATQGEVCPEALSAAQRREDARRLSGDRREIHAPGDRFHRGVLPSGRGVRYGTELSLFRQPSSQCRPGQRSQLRLRIDHA